MNLSWRFVVRTLPVIVIASSLLMDAPPVSGVVWPPCVRVLLKWMPYSLPRPKV